MIAALRWRLARRCLSCHCRARQMVGWWFCSDGCADDYEQSQGWG